MLKITDFADQGGVDRLVYFVEEIWGTLHPDCGPNDLEAIEEEAAVVIAERNRLRRELEEAKSELARMRPVVEAAAEFDEPCGDEICASPTCRVARAMNAYRASIGKEDE